MLSASSVEWIDEAMAHNNAHDGEQWMRLLVEDRALDAVDALAAMRNASAQLAAHHDQTPGGTEQQ